MPAQDLIDNLITYLEMRRETGEKLIPVSTANRRFLTELLANPSPQQSTPQRPSEASQKPGPAPTRKRPGGVASDTAAYSPTTKTGTAETSAELDLSTSDWSQLKELVPACRRCQLVNLGRRQTVFGAGDEAADLMFIGEGPGSDEDREGIPFVGEAGKLLTKIIEAMQFSRDEVYIANIVKCRPPRNRNPEPPEANACLPYLIRQIELVQPKVIVTLGAVPLQSLVNKPGITRNRGRWLQFRGIDLMPTFHPAYLARKPEAKREVWEDMQKVMSRLGKTPPAAGTAKN